MRTIYIDENYICHATDDGTRTAVETDALDSVCNSALECYKFIPTTKDKAELIQCIDSKSAAIGESAFQDGINSQDETIAELMDEIANLCEELIGE